FLAGAGLPPDAEILGPVPIPGRRGERSPGDRALIRVPPGSGAALAAALKTAQAARTARGVAAADAVRVRIDPPDIG
ncbi:primosome assembly protein PriA, partial [Streptomyces sp. MB09-01]|nr:primosome assembly protein PriA [Streptomyces sp. MB09-01]